MVLNGEVLGRETCGHDLPYTLRFRNILVCFVQRTGDSVMLQRAIHRPLTAEDRVLNEACPLEICGRQSGVFSDLSVFPLSVALHQCSILIFIY
jgi:hypothetical protein